MKRKLSAMEARQRFGEILEGVHYRGDEVVIERAGKPMAVIIPTERYDALQQSRERVFAFIEKNRERNKDIPYEQIERDVASAVQADRAKQKRGPKRG